ncbi:MAG: hypothetical protein LBP22_15180 [Deltaproteobacteria bacterium]|jgi:hypothetical protein|nr:hypothetical protein [Deltaproteobacteria bacterium]
MRTLGIDPTVPGADSAGIIENLPEKHSKRAAVVIDGHGVPVSENLGSPTAA